MFGDGYYGTDELVSTSAQLSAYQKFAYVSIAIDNISRDAGNRNYIFVTKEGVEIDINRVPDEIRVPIEHGYADQDLEQILATIVAHVKLTGNGYLWVSKTTAFGEYRAMADSLIPLDPAQVKPLLSSSGLLLKGYEIEIGNQKKLLNPEEIIHFRQNTLINPWVGIGDIAKARTMFATELSKGKYEQTFFKKGANPSMVITEEEERLPEETERFVQLLQDKYSGSENAGKVLYLPGKGVKAQAFPLSHKDMEYLDSKKFNAETVLNLFGVPPSVAGVKDGVNRATAEIAKINYFQSTINPIIADYERTLNKQFINKIDANIFIQFERHTTGDVENVIKKLQAGIITPNMASEQLGEATSDDQGRDDYYMPANFFPVSLGTGEEEKKVPHETTCDCGSDHKDVKSDLLDPHNWEMITKNFEEVAKPNRKFQARFLRESLKARLQTEDKFTPAIEKFYIGQKNRVVNAMINNKDQIEKVIQTKAWYDDIVSIIFDIKAENELTREAIRPLHTSAVQKAIINNNEIIGATVNPNLSNPYVANRIDILGKNIVGSVDANGAFIAVNETIRKSIANIVLKGVENGESIAELTTKIDTALGGGARLKARRIARTESRIAYDAGSILTYKELGAEYVDVVGCTQFEPDSDCGAVKVPVSQPLTFHPNHVGSIVPHDKL